MTSLSGMFKNLFGDDGTSEGLEIVSIGVGVSLAVGSCSLLLMLIDTVDSLPRSSDGDPFFLKKTDPYPYLLNYFL